MAKADGGLRALFRHHIPGWQWSAVESGMTSPGIPDSDYCAPGGAQGWIEFKRAPAWRVTLRPLQIAWIGRRARLGGRVWIGVRRAQATSDELWLISGVYVQELAGYGLKPLHEKAQGWAGGPNAWAWGDVAKILSGPA